MKTVSQALSTRLPEDRLFDLLPLVYRERDAERGGPLRALLQLLAEQLEIVESDIQQLYENWFIETCRTWVVPYIGDLIGYPLPQIPLDTEDSAVRMLARILAPRREVANTIHYRRRKGSLALLEQLASDIAGWPARAVEFDRFISATEASNYPMTNRPSFVDLRQGEALDLLGSAFDQLPHTVDLRRPDSAYSSGLYNLSSVGLFVARLHSLPVTRCEAYRVEEAGEHCFSFSALSHSAPLFRQPQPEQHPEHIAGEMNLPGPIRRRAFEEKLAKDAVEQRVASPAYYGEGKSLAIWAGAWGQNDPSVPVPFDRITPANLTDWRYHPKPGYIAVDPVLGRFAFAPGDAPEGDVTVSYHYGSPTYMGGGEYPRKLEMPADAAVYRVGRGEDFDRPEAAIKRWRSDDPPDAIIEIADSQVYTIPRFTLELGENQRLAIRASSGARPIIRLIDLRASRGDAMAISGDRLSHLTLDGLLITGRGVQIKGDLDQLIIRHCTLVPGWDLHHDCRPHSPQEPSLTLNNTGVRLRIEDSIVGGIQVNQESSNLEPNTIELRDSIIDSTSPDIASISSADRAVAPAKLTIGRCTVIGTVTAHELQLAENSIFVSRVSIARRQQGCLRYCYMPPQSRTPRQYRCQPATAAKMLIGDERQAVEQTLIPVFQSTRYGSPDYCRLAESCPDEIRRGADDESEMGVYHNLYEPQRYSELMSRLAEYVPAGYDISIIYTN